MQRGERRWRWRHRRNTARPRADSDTDAHSDSRTDAHAQGFAAGRKAGLEEAAKVAEEFPTEVLAFWDRPGGPPGNGYVPTTPKHIAQAIRTLGEKSSG